jgi:precorrin-2 dehydrogenase/sirohydrochlorin ferrochelatase/precorrin-6A/cobalt-precorrin-6A reductase
MSEPPRFPVFISLYGKDVLVVGGGVIAARRVAVLLEFGARITLVTPEVSEGLQGLLGCVRWRRERYSGFDKPYTLAIAATNDRDTNKQIGIDAKSAGVPCSVADCKEESTFWFPAVLRANGFVAGLVSEDGNHSAVKKAAERLRRSLEESHV